MKTKTNLEKVMAKPLIEQSIHGESKIVTAGGRWLVNQRGDFSPACAAKVNAEYEALNAIAEAAKAMSEYGARFASDAPTKEGRERENAKSITETNALDTALSRLEALRKENR